MRLCGEVDSARSLGLHDHVRWVYDDPGEFHWRALEFLSDGLAQGQRVRYLTHGDGDELLHVLESAPRLASALRSGAAQVHQLAEGDTAASTAQLRTLAAATHEALAEGYTGFRVAAEATGSVCKLEQPSEYARYEHLVDRYTTREPFAALCAYDRRAIGTDLAAQFACLHPAGNADITPFRLHACRDADIALSGELDLSCQDLLCRALERVDPHPQGGELVIDAKGLTFVDHRSLFRLAEFAQRRGATVALRTNQSAPARLVEILDVPAVRVEWVE